MKSRPVALSCLVVALTLIGASVGASARSSSTSTRAAPSGSWQEPTWTWPLQPAPEVVAPFDPPSTPYGPGHLGVDLLGYAGQPVRATAGGTVSFAGQVAGKPVVVVDHGTERSTYEPVVAGVRRGAQVVAGQPIGTLVVATGHCPPQACLHLGRRVGDAYLDPLDLLGGGGVRLLPRERTTPGRAAPPRLAPAYIASAVLAVLNAMTGDAGRRPWPG